LVRAHGSTMTSSEIVQKFLPLKRLSYPDLDAVIEATIREIDDLTTKQINATNAMLKAEARAREKDTRRFQYLQNIPKTEAQAFFWNFDSRRQ